MGDRTPFDLLKQRFNRNWDIGEDKDRESEGIKNLLPSAAVDIVPFCDGCQDAEGEQNQIVVCHRSTNGAQCNG